MQDQGHLQMLQKCVHLFNKYLLSDTQGLGTFPGIRDTAVNKTNKNVSPHAAYILVILMTGH